jgi:serine/threonine-protein kinase
MPQPSWIGQTLNGRYRIEALLGQGGMSAVYRANDPNLKRTVAIKLIHSHLSNDQQFIQRFQEEAAAIAALRHPNIVQVHDFNSEADVHYMVLEYVPGETLFARLQRLSEKGEKLPIAEALGYGLNICDALSYAHRRGMIHRDIKPANIMLNEDGQAILMDFGIVKIMGGSNHTATGTVLGTARYISPELVRSEPADQRSDIYSLGITLYEMLSGRTPFESDSTLTLLMMHLNDPVPDPRSLRDDLPTALVNILLKSLEKDPARRYQSAAELAADLQAVLKTLPNTSPEQAPAEVRSSVGPSLTAASPALQPAPPARPNSSLPWLLGLGAGLFLLVLILATAGGIWISRQLASAPTREPVATSVSNVVRLDATPAQQNPPPAAPLPTTTQPNFLVTITAIKRRGSQYEVQYETTGFTEKMPWMHIHFFFNNVAPEQAGKPGRGPWIMYGGPRPFTGYSISQTPEGASQLCALVANADHTVILGSGNCVDLPPE